MGELAAARGIHRDGLPETGGDGALGVVMRGAGRPEAAGAPDPWPLPAFFASLASMIAFFIRSAAASTRLESACLA